MSWWTKPTPLSSTRSGNPNFTAEAREERRKEIEAKRLEVAKKRSARKAFLAAGVSAPSSPTTSRAPSPVRDYLSTHGLPINTIPEIDDDLLSLPDLTFNEMAELFEDKTADDDKEAWKKTLTVKFNKHEVEYFFTAAEAQMKSFGINKQVKLRLQRPAAR